MKRSLASLTTLVICLLHTNSSFADMTQLSNGSYNVRVLLEEGWSHVACFVPDFIQPESEIKPEDISVIWAFVPTAQEFYPIYPEHLDASVLGTRAAELGRMISDQEILSSVCWVHSKRFGVVEFHNPEGVIPLQERQMAAGWNFVLLSQEFMNRSLQEFQGNCTIEKIAGYQRMKWEVVTPGTISQQEHPDIRAMGWDGLILVDNEQVIGQGILMKMRQSCSLNGAPAFSPPSLPD